MIDTVFFDVGGTLIYADPSVPEAFTLVARRLGHDVDIKDALNCMRDVDEFYQSEYLRDGDFWCVHERAVQIWLDMYKMMATYCGISDGVDELAQAVYDEYLLPKYWSIYDDVEPCLKELKQRGCRLAIVSNWDATLEQLIRLIGLLPYFDEVIASAAVGCRKPHRAVFEIALERMDASPANVAHVGDLVEADGDGASHAGLLPVIIDRKGASPDCPYSRVSALTDLVRVLSLKNG